MAAFHTLPNALPNVPMIAPVNGVRVDDVYAHVRLRRLRETRKVCGAR